MHFLEIQLQTVVVICSTGEGKYHTKFYYHQRKVGMADTLWNLQSFQVQIFQKFMFQMHKVISINFVYKPLWKPFEELHVERNAGEKFKTWMHLEDVALFEFSNSYVVWQLLLVFAKKLDDNPRWK